LLKLVHLLLCDEWQWAFTGGLSIQDGQRNVEGADTSRRRMPGAAAVPGGITSSDAPKHKSPGADGTIPKETVSS
jgi:hypothetical protein